MKAPRSKKKAESFLRLPALEAERTRLSVGVVRHVLQAEKTAKIVENREIRVSGRRSEPLVILDSGEAVIVTEGRSCPCPNDVVGVLRVEAGKPNRWLSHRLLDAFTARSTTPEQFKGQVAESWANALRFQAEIVDASGRTTRRGLRPPQVGALHAIGAHWSLHRHPATIIMPTGTGKTETMLAALVGFVGSTALVIVPSTALREQTAKKFLTLGLLRDLGIIPADLANPVVGVITSRPKSVDDLAIFDACHVVIGTMAALGQGTAVDFIPEVAAKVDTLIVDEAHHVPAGSWSAFREQFEKGRVLQFTATPFRRDGLLVDGEVIYSYPLRRAQQDGFFKPIRFEPVYELDPEEVDTVIANAAVAKLDADRKAGKDHLLMARCETIERAEAVQGIYASIAARHHPVLVHSHAWNVPESLDGIKRGENRIVVCVDMLGEGFDLPQLKIAAVHDPHKSLAVILQFTGRFTRSTGANIGDATVVANIADVSVSHALERLYSEDADWNYLLSEFSSQAVREHAELVEFLNASQRLDEADVDSQSISPSLLRPTFSGVVYQNAEFRPKKFFEGLGPGIHVRAVWLHSAANTLFFVTCSEPHVPWSRSKELRDRQWDLFVLHHDPQRKLLYLHSSDRSSLHERLAQAVAGDKIQLIRGDAVFRTLGNIKRLVFQNIGVRKIGRRNLRYAMYTGADVKQALSVAERSGSVKSNLSGSGYEGGRPVTIGCSYKGRVWSREQGAIRRFLDWCAGVGSKLTDSSIDTAQIIDNVLIPDEVYSMPDAGILAIDWPLEMLRQSGERVTLSWSDGKEGPLSMFEIAADETRPSGSLVRFCVGDDQGKSHFALHVGGERGFEVRHLTGPRPTIRIGRIEKPLDEYLSDYPPLVRFLDLSELDGNLLVRPQTMPTLTIPQERFEPWDWTGTDIRIESLWKLGTERPASIQGRAAAHYRDGGFEVVFDDDMSGEAADLVCFKEESEHIRLALVHCKFTSEDNPGRRVEDVVEVCSQAVRSGKWIWRFRELCRHILIRERKLRIPNRPSRFIVGEPKNLNRLLQASRFKPVRAEIVIVQPGLSQTACTTEQTAVLAAAYNFLKETGDVDLDIVCSE